MMNRHTRITLAGVALAAAIGVFYFTVLGGRSSSGTSGNESSSEAIGPAVNGVASELKPLFGESTLIFEVQPTAQTLSDVVDKLNSRARELFLDLPINQTLDANRLNEFTSLWRERIQLLLDPNFDDWIRQVERFGGEASGPTGPKFARRVVYDPAHPDLHFQTQWEGVAAATRLTPLSIKSLRVRPHRARGVDIQQSRARRVFGPAFWGGYHEGSAIGYLIGDEKIDLRFSDVYEVVVPMLFQQTRALNGESSPSVEDIRSQIGVWIAWDTASARWIPYGLVGYDQGTDSPGILPPPF